MNIELRDPNKIMKLSRLGSFHQSKLSFLRSFLNEFKDWEYKRDLFKLNENGFAFCPEVTTKISKLNIFQNMDPMNEIY